MTKTGPDDEQERREKNNHRVSVSDDAPTTVDAAAAATAIAAASVVDDAAHAVGPTGRIDGNKGRRKRVVALCLCLTSLVLVQFRTFTLFSPEWRIKYIYGGDVDDGDTDATSVPSVVGPVNATGTTTTTAGGGDDGEVVAPNGTGPVAISDAAPDVELTYLPWELDSIMSVNFTTTVNASAGGGPKEKDILGGRCVPPPPSSDKMCCLGSSSAGGATYFKRSAQCAVGGDAYERVRVAAMGELNRGGSLQLPPSPSPPSAGRGGRSSSPSPPPTTCDVCRIVDLSLRHNWTIGFTGDSVHHQVWDGFLCELSRNGYTYTSSIVNPDQGMNTRWRYGVKSIETVSIQVPVPAAAARGDDGDGDGDGDGVVESASRKTIEDGTSTSTTRATTTAAAAAPAPATATATVTARYYAQYRPLEDMTELARIASETDVLVFNFGVHWLRDVEADYTSTMRDVLSTFLRGNATDGGGFAVLATRETSAQHFSNPGGEFKRGVQPPCVEMDDDDEVFGWRERIVDRVAGELGYDVVRSDAETLSSRLAAPSNSASGGSEGKETRGEDGPPAGGSLSANVGAPEGLLGRLLRRGRRRLLSGEVDANSTRSDPATEGTTTPPQQRREDPFDGRDRDRDELLVLPFLNFTRGLIDLHKIGVSGDCTHFCSSPFLWSPLWRSLRLGMDYREERLLRRPASTP